MEKQTDFFKSSEAFYDCTAKWEMEKRRQKKVYERLSFHFLVTTEKKGFLEIWFQFFIIDFRLKKQKLNVFNVQNIKNKKIPQKTQPSFLKNCPAENSKIIFESLFSFIVILT